MPDLTVPAVLFALVLLILLGQWITVRHAQSMRGNPAPQELIELLATDEPGRSDGLFFFESPNCGACHRMAPIVDNLARLHSLPLYHLNVQTQQGLARTLRIMGTPTTLLVHDGLIVDVIVGTISESSLRGKLSRYWSQ